MDGTYRLSDSNGEEIVASGEYIPKMVGDLEKKQYNWE
jgi:hypothetical protein